MHPGMGGWYIWLPKSPVQHSQHSCIGLLRGWGYLPTSRLDIYLSHLSIYPFKTWDWWRHRSWHVASQHRGKHNIVFSNTLNNQPGFIYIWFQFCYYFSETELRTRTTCSPSGGVGLGVFSLLWRDSLAQPCQPCQPRRPNTEIQILNLLRENFQNRIYCFLKYLLRILAGGSQHWWADQIWTVGVVSHPSSSGVRPRITGLRNVNVIGWCWCWCWSSWSPGSRI